MEKVVSKKISGKIKTIMGNRGYKYEYVGKLMGITKQGVSYVLNNRQDKDWTEKEIDYWCKVLKIEPSIIYEIKNSLVE